MDEDQIDPERRRKAFYALREARQAIEEMLAIAASASDTRPVFEKLKKWLPSITEAEKDMGNLLSDRDPLDHAGDLRRIVPRLRQLGQRQTDAIAEKIERALAEVMF